MKYVVEKNIPIPPKRPGPAKNPLSITAQLRALKKGESIFFKDKKQAAISTAGRKAAYGTDQKYTTRLVDGGVRIWRVS